MYMDPIPAMTQISQRMWQVQGPRSLSISLEKHIFIMSIVLRSCAVHPSVSV